MGIIRDLKFLKMRLVEVGTNLPLTISRTGSGCVGSVSGKSWRLEKKVKGPVRMAKGNIQPYLVVVRPQDRFKAAELLRISGPAASADTHSWDRTTNERISNNDFILWVHSGRKYCRSFEKDQEK